METNTDVADQNTERLIQSAYQPERVPADFAASLTQKMTETAKVLAQKQLPPAQPPRRWGRVALIVGGLAASVLLIVALWSALRRPQQPPKDAPTQDIVQDAKKPADIDAPVQLARWTDDVRDGMQPRVRPAAPTLATLKDGQKLTTKAGQRRLVQLGDGTRVFVNEKTEIEVVAPRQLRVHAGQVYLEVAPQAKAANFVVKTTSREMTATGTHFAVHADDGVIVTQGKVAVKGIDKEVTAGQQVAAGASAITSAVRASHTLAWTRDLLAAAETPMVPACQHAGGELIALDPQGQEIKLSLRYYHIDVHIEDGFARTTIDQTYFNTTWERLEGTFYFPLPADASLSRLAMYVADGNQCKLMEGGMAERKHAADVYETIRYMRRDPALLEWLDGSTFKMRVFPLEAKQEKRIILSYTQKLPSLYGGTRYRFTGGLNMPAVREWSFNARIKSGAGMTIWSPTVPNAQLLPQGGDMIVRHFASNVKPEADVTIEMQDKIAVQDNDVPRFASILHDNQQYLMLRYRPTLPSLPERQRRDWIILFEASAQRDPVVAGTQVDVLRHLLKNAEYDDTFMLLAVNSKAQAFDEKPRAANPANVADAIKFLQGTHLVGALDLEKGLQAALKFAKNAKNPHVLHVGSGIPAMGQRDAGKLAHMLPERVPYVGVGVGKRWNRAFMKSAAERTSGLFTQINPDEVVAWRAFDLLATLNTPRLLDVQVVSDEARFLGETTMIAQGEEICAMTRVGTNKGALPGKVVIKGTLDGKPYVKEFAVGNVMGGAGYLPRTWAKLEIDRLLAADAAKHKADIIALSKAMYVMTPYTSLLVLETDADYEKYKVDRGRKDHWAMYPCPAKVPLVYEPNGKAPPKALSPEAKNGKPSVEQVARTIVGTPSASAQSALAVFTGSSSLNAQTDAIRTLRYNPALEASIARFDATWMKGIPDVVNIGSVSSPFVPGQGVKPFANGATANISFLQDFRKLQVTDLPLESTTPAGGFGGDAGLRTWTEDWGKLPPAERQRSLQKLTAGMSPRQREAIAAYMQKLQSSAGAGIGRGTGLLPQQLLQAKVETKKKAFDLDMYLKANSATPEVLNIDATDLSEFAGWRGFTVKLKDTNKSIEFDDPTTGRIQFAPVFVSPKMQWAVPNEDFGAEIGLQNPLLFNRSSDFFPPSLALIVRGPSRIHTSITGGIIGSRSSRPEAAALRYERPQLEYNRRLFSDLTQYAPGLRATWADTLATLEDEADVELPKPGVIEPAARKLIDRARSSDWQTMTIPARGPIPSYDVRFNGIGQFTYERMLGSGLREQVVCDGKTLWHLYPEIGLAGKRRFSRHHHDLIEAIQPAFLPGADELARGCDLKALDASTVAIVPMWAAKLKKDDKYARVHLIFARDGRLSERRIVEMPAAKTLARQMFAVDGIKWLDANDKVVASATPPHPRPLSPGGERGAVRLQPDVSDLVVIALPIRTPEHIIAQAKKREVDPDRDPATLHDRFIASCVRGEVSGVHRALVTLKLLVTPSNRKLGYYVLLNAIDSTHASMNAAGDKTIVGDKKWLPLNPEMEHPNNALARFVAQIDRDVVSNDNAPFRAMPGPRDGFIQRMARFRDLWLTWQQQRPLQNAGELPMHKAKVMEFLQDTPSPLFAYAILDTMQRRCNIAPSERMTEIAVKRFGPISEDSGLGYVFRYEHGRSLYQAGLGAEADKQFRDLYVATLKRGALPPLDASFRDALQTQSAQSFVEFVRKTKDELLDKKRFGFAFQLAAQMDQLGDEALGDEVLAAILAKASDKERNAVTLACIHAQAQRKNIAQADRLLGKLLQDKDLAQHVELWRWRGALASQLGQSSESVRCLEKALDLEFAELPEVVNLERLRADYRVLLDHYQRIAEASVLLEKSAPKAFLAKVIRTTDRWRLVDPDVAEPCRRAGKILQTVGEGELAWDYWTTPIDLSPAESKPWLDLAESMKSEGNLERADRAFALGFEAEPTNPEILWKRAQNLARLGQPEQARALYRQIADGQWQDRFAATVQQARGLAGN